MRILGIECSATPCSAAIMQDGKLIASAFSNIKVTHSQTLMPLVESVLRSANMELSQIEAFAVSAGPGSFTGVRIGISAVKGMAAPKKLPCVAVSTLSAMAENYADTECFVCAVMDARCRQLYNAVFEITDGEITRLCEDRALLFEELEAELKTLAKKGKKIIIVGDGAEIFYPTVNSIHGVVLAKEHLRFQNAVGVCAAALKAVENNEFISPDALVPTYLRMPQAERELKLKKEKQL